MKPWQSVVLSLTLAAALANLLVWYKIKLTIDEQAARLGIKL